MTHAENKKKKAQKVGAIALALVILGGGGFGAYYGLTKPESTEEPVEVVDDDSDKVYHIDDVDIELGDDGNYIVKEKDRDFDDLEKVAVSVAKEIENEDETVGRDFTHLEQVVIAEAQENVTARRDFGDLEKLALAEAKEREKGSIVREKDGGLAFETGNNQSVDKDLTASIEDKQEKPVEPEKPIKPVEPEIPTKPVEPVEPEVPTKPVEPVDPEPVITTDISYKTEYLGFDVEEVEDSTLEKEKTEVVQKGVSGSRTTKYKVTYKDGKEIKRDVIEVKEELPVNKIIHVGTKDSQPLKSLVNYVEGLVEDDYIEDSWASLIEQLDGAKDVLANERSSQEEVDNALTNLQTSINSLVEIEDSDVEIPEDGDGDPEDEDENTEGEEIENPEDEDENTEGEEIETPEDEQQEESDEEEDGDTEGSEGELSEDENTEEMKV